MRRLILAANLGAPVVALALLLEGAIVWAVATIAIAHILWFVPTLWPNCTWFGPVVRRLPAGRGERVWLTVDDGPDPEDTPRMLDMLDRHGAKATFFVIGAKAQSHPELIRDIARRGHGLGNHTMTHPDKWFWAYGPGRIRREVLDCQSALARIVPETPVCWFRAPVGMKNGFVHPVLSEVGGLSLVGWSVRGLDGVSRDANRVLKRLDRGLRPGAIILIHEGRLDRHGNRLGPQVLAGLLARLSERGLACKEPASDSDYSAHLVGSAGA